MNRQIVKEQLEKINSTINKIEALYGEMGKKYGLNYNALMVLYSIDGIEKCTQKQIADMWHLPKSTVHSIFRDFEKKGYVIIEPDDKNKKEEIIVFTEEGKEYKNRVLSEIKEIEYAVIEAIGEDVTNQLLSSNEAFYKALKNEVDKNE